MWQRLITHLVTPASAVQRRFTQTTLDQIETAIADGESRHAGEVCFAAEACLDLAPLWRGQTGRERALDVFSMMRVWDTPNNNGVLVYLLLADHDIEIIADRGVSARVPDEAWQRVCRAMETRLRQGKYVEAVTTGLNAVNELLTQHLPAAPDGERNRLSNKPVIL